MTRGNFSRANELIVKINKIEHKLCELYDSELSLNSKMESESWSLFKIQFSKQQILSVLKYNREILKSQKEVLEKMLSNI
jgi:hypothetical protein